MEQALEFVASYQWWIFGILGLILLFYLRRALLARRAGARSIFKLEQEQARSRYMRSVIVAALVMVVMVAVFVLSNPVMQVVAPTPQPTAMVTNGPLLAATLTPTPPPATMTPTPTATPVRPTRQKPPTPTSEVVGTPTAAAFPAACPNPNVRITSPGMNQVVQGNVPVRGTASHSSFQYYKVEVGQGNNPREWTVVGQLHQTPVNGGVLETFNANAYPAGTYTLRLVVVDQTGNYPEPCQVTITVQP